MVYCKQSFDSFGQLANAQRGGMGWFFGRQKQFILSQEIVKQQTVCRCAEIFWCKMQEEVQFDRCNGNRSRILCDINALHAVLPKILFDGKGRFSRRKCS